MPHHRRELAAKPGEAAHVRLVPLCLIHIYVSGDAHWDINHQFAFRLSTKRAMSAKTLIVGLSGVSSSGKTTVARLLRELFPNSFILHQDDFYRPDDQIPVKNAIQDWDCIEAIDVAKLVSCLTYIKEHSSLPPDFHSKEDQNSVGDCNVDRSKFEERRSIASQMLEVRTVRRVVFVDGFLLYSRELQAVQGLLDIKLFLRTDYQIAKARREARRGYVTLEGYWEDPPGYVDKVVWPNYVKEHSYLFRNGNIEEPCDDLKCSERNIRPVPDGLQEDLDGTLAWAYRTVIDHLVDK